MRLSEMVIMCGIVLGFALIHEASSKKVKREVDLAAGFCVVECVGDYYNSTAFAGRSDDAGSPLCKHVEMPEIDAICSMYTHGKDCVKEKCFGRPLAEMLYNIAAYGCDQHYEEFKKYTPCFTENCPYVENSCKTKCGSFMDAIKYSPEQKKKLDQIRRISRLRKGKNGHDDNSDRSSDSDEDTGLGELDVLRSFNLEGACRYANCYGNCSQQPLTEECGPETYQFFKKVLLDLIPMFFHGLFPNMTEPPESCTLILGTSKPNAVDIAAVKSSGAIMKRESIWGMIFLFVLCMILGSAWGSKTFVM